MIGSTTVTLSLARFARRSNRRRAVEAVARGLPWIAAGAALVVLALMRGYVAGAVCVAAAAIAGITALVIRRLRRLWVGPAGIARVLDEHHRTADLLRTAVAIEAKPAASDVEQVVLSRARDFVPKIAEGAIAPLRLRTSPLGFVALGVTALIWCTSPRQGEAAKPSDALSEKARAKAEEIEKAVDALASDKSLSGDVKEQLQKAKDALKRAASAKTGTEALSALSEASRLLDEAAPHIAASKSDELEKLGSDQLANQLASAAKAGDASRVQQLARELMKRASSAQDGGAALGEMVKQAAANAGDPWGAGSGDSAGQRLEQLAQAGDAMKNGDIDSARSALSDLSKGAKPGAMDPKAAQLAAARRALSDLRSATRTAMNGPTRPMTEQEARDAAAQAARDAASGKSGAPKPGSGTGKMAGMGKMPGSGKTPGPGMGQMPGTGPMAGNGQPQPGGTPQDGANHLGVLQQGTSDQHGSSGTSGMKGSSPSGATAPETVMAEEVKTDQPPPTTPDGIIRAIREHSSGDHTPTAFQALRDRYAAVAEATMHRDEIPLTRRDFIQRYFEALRTREEP
ncbi:MAG TPA: hypothetical protein VLT45_23445 [Kofleriaceae bacterium]|nr:hypothetical protein [Kofleriaceae bacterium]